MNKISKILDWIAFEEKQETQTKIVKILDHIEF
jgi:hypothetical protein